jgi:hypothetical protein
LFLEVSSEELLIVYVEAKDDVVNLFLEVSGLEELNR